MKQPALPQQALQLSIPKIRQATQEQEQTKELTKEQEMEQDQPNTNPVAIKKSALGNPNTVFSSLWTTKGWLESKKLMKI